MFGSKLREGFFLKIESISVLKKWGYPCKDDCREEVTAKKEMLFIEIFLFELLLFRS